MAPAVASGDALALLTIYRSPAEAASDGSRFEPIPPELAEHLGQDWVEYESFVTARLPLSEAELVAEEAREGGYLARVESGSRILGPAFTFDLTANRLGPWTDVGGVEVTELNELWWVQFAHPIKREWRTALHGCQAIPLGEMPSRALLVWATDRAFIESCPEVESYIDQIAAMLSTDRVRPDYFALDGPFEVLLAPGVGTVDLELSLDVGSTVTPLPEDSGLLVAARVEGADVLQQLLADSRVVTIVPTSSAVELASERENQILARNFVGGSTVGQPATTPSYTEFLEGRGLDSASNQQTIAVFDSGIDDPTSGTFHSDLAGKIEPVWGFYKAVSGTAANNDTVEDQWGHGTVVASIAAGSGGSGVTSGGFRLGLGVAPDAKLISVRMIEGIQGALCNTNTALGNIDKAYDYVRLFPSGHDNSGQDWARIANNSWNTLSTGYTTDVARQDRRVADATSLTPTTLDPMTVVASTGNFVPGASLADRLVRVPGTAKNVISVGAVDSWYPGTLPASERYCFGQATAHPVPVGPFQPSDFSRYSALATTIDESRVKPDLVAPGWRVDGAQPDGPLTCPPATPSDSDLPNKLICRQEENKPQNPAFTYGRGTSFAAPQVSGAAALAIKQFLDASHDPSPALVKAALIATAQSLGPKNSSTGMINCTGSAHGCRPSFRYGWGLVDVDRLTNSVPRWWFDEGYEMTFTGDGWVSPWLQPASSSNGEDILIVLVWTDPVPVVGGGLVRDLDLVVTRMGSSRSWWGNGFLSTGYSHPVQAGSPPMPQDEANNVEAVFLRADQGLSGWGAQDEWPFRIFVSAAAFGIEGNWPDPLEGKQPFAVYAYNVTVCGVC